MNSPKPATKNKRSSTQIQHDNLLRTGRRKSVARRRIFRAKSPPIQCRSHNPIRSGRIEAAAGTEKDRIFHLPKQKFEIPPIDSAENQQPRAKNKKKRKPKREMKETRDQKTVGPPQKMQKLSNYKCRYRRFAVKKQSVDWGPEREKRKVSHSHT